MITDWTKGLTEDTEDFIAKFKATGWLVRQWNRVLLNKLNELNRPSTSSDYDSASWAYRAAHREGFKEALNYILLLTKEERTE